jgi:hypothetical protein
MRLANGFVELQEQDDAKRCSEGMGSICSSGKGGHSPELSWELLVLIVSSNLYVYLEFVVISISDST